MSVPRPLARKPADNPMARSGGVQPLSALAERISAGVARAEGHSTPEGQEILAQVRVLLEEQRAQQDALEERLGELASLSDFLQTHSEREKALLARELHDSLGGILTPAKMDLAWLESRLGNEPEYTERMRRLNALIDSGIDLKRRVIENLHPSLLDHLGLASALQWSVEESCRAAGIECRLMVSEDLERLAPDLEISLYRLVQEGVGNVVKHAKAHALELKVDRTADGVQVRIADDGVGMGDIDKAKRLSHGLAGMMHRVRSAGGSFEVQSQPGNGTRIDIFVPLKKK